mmetsp:Transcript_100631/g.281986  ORF Transcript_100631/g.281986 Transcript_100631/m.281986 type:complete len:202 (+) Transcript_100631:495-1100(+)
MIMTTTTRPAPSGRRPSPGSVAKATMPPTSIVAAIDAMPSTRRERRPARSTRPKLPMALPMKKEMLGVTAEARPTAPTDSKSVPPKETMALIPVMIWKSCTAQPSSTTFRRWALPQTSPHVALPAIRSSSSSARTVASSAEAAAPSPSRRRVRIRRASSDLPTLSRNRGVSPTKAKPMAVARPKAVCTPNDMRQPISIPWS